MSVIKEYFEYLSKYEKLYGKNVAVLMQIGHFYEVYGINNDTHKKGKVAEIAKILNVELTRRSKKILENNFKNPLMMGFPCHVIDVYLPLLLNNNYTVIIIDQENTLDINGNNKIIRKTKEVVSPSTYINGDFTQKYNWLISMFFIRKEGILHIGMSAIDVMTCMNITHECKSSFEDTNLSMDEAISFLRHYDPREILFQGKKALLESLDLVRYFELSNKVMCHFKDVDPLFLRKEFQNHTIGSVFENKTMISNLELLGFNNKPYAATSYVLLISFLFDHNVSLVSKMSMPNTFLDSNRLLLAKNAIDQLDVIPDLLNVIDHCSTIMGKRLLKDRLLSPISCEAELNKRYDQIESFNKYYFKNVKEIERILKNISDIGRLRRKMLMETFNPNDLLLMYQSCKIALELNKFLCAQAHAQTVNIRSEQYRYRKVDARAHSLRSYHQVLELLNDQDIEKINKFLKQCDDNLFMDHLRNYKRDNLMEISSVFKIGIYPEIDIIITNINQEMLVLKNIQEHLSNYLTFNATLKLEFSQSMGYHFVSTNAQAEKLKHIRYINIIKNNKSFSRITSSDIEKSSRNILVLTESLKKHIKNKYVVFMEQITNIYDPIFIRIKDFIANIDVIKSNYKLSHIYGYCRPVICSNRKSFFKAKDIRHALIEQIHTDTRYVPNDVTIGCEYEGMIIYSMNACGKTSLIKACGVSVLLAQMGSFVPASSFEFSPFSKIMTRIKNEDNINTGRSSFVSEMMELRDILNRADSNTLVLADEITCGTEHISGSAIFASSVITLAQKKVNFMFTTHLHNIYRFIMNIENVKIFHLSVLFENNAKKIIFERKLKEGPGECIYGLEVCNYLNMDRNFLNMAFSIRNEIIKVETQCAQTNTLCKTSRYNINKIIHNCEICGYIPKDKMSIPLDTHHIEPNNKSLKEVFSINAKYNLVALCKTCHIKVHNKEIHINGYKETSEGIILDFTHVQSTVLYL